MFFLSIEFWGLRAVVQTPNPLTHEACTREELLFFERYNKVIGFAFHCNKL